MHDNVCCWLLAAWFMVGCSRGPKVEPTEQGAGNEGPVQCGSATCAAGQICCNPSCGICTAPDGMCTQQFCDEPSAGADAGPTPVTCDSVRCASGSHCVLLTVQCVRTPCPPVPECRPDSDAGMATPSP